jgi:hypothetical protein
LDESYLGGSVAGHVDVLVSFVVLDQGRVHRSVQVRQRVEPSCGSPGR